jgi:hypothetical protein
VSRSEHLSSSALLILCMLIDLPQVWWARAEKDVNGLKQVAVARINEAEGFGLVAQQQVRFPLQIIPFCLCPRFSVMSRLSPHSSPGHAFSQPTLRRCRVRLTPSLSME